MAQERGLAALDAVDGEGGLPAGLIGRDFSMPPDGDALGSVRPSALDDVGLSPGGVDADAEAGEVSVPVEDVSVAGAERIDGALGDGTMVLSRAWATPVSRRLSSLKRVSVSQAPEVEAKRMEDRLGDESKRLLKGEMANKCLYDSLLWYLSALQRAGDI